MSFRLSVTLKYKLKIHRPSPIQQGALGSHTHNDRFVSFCHLEAGIVISYKCTFNGSI